MWPELTVDAPGDVFWTHYSRFWTHYSGRQDL
jgi:hypothetical protein